MAARQPARGPLQPRHRAPARGPFADAVGDVCRGVPRRSGFEGFARTREARLLASRAAAGKIRGRCPPQPTSATVPLPPRRTPRGVAGSGSISCAASAQDAAFLWRADRSRTCPAARPRLPGHRARHRPAEIAAALRDRRRHRPRRAVVPVSHHDDGPRARNGAAREQHLQSARRRCRSSSTVDYMGRSSRSSAEDVVARRRPPRVLAPGAADRVLDQLGPAVNAGHSLFVYGPPGNGKTVISQAIRNLLRGDFSVPHAVDVDGHIIQVFDPVSTTNRCRIAPTSDGLELTATTIAAGYAAGGRWSPSAAS